MEPVAALKGFELHELSRVLLDTLADIVFVIDPDWHVTYLNAAAEKHFGVTVYDFGGGTLFDRLEEFQDTEFEVRWRYALKDQTYVQFEGECLVRDCWWDVRCYPLDGQLAIHMADCTARKRAEAELRESKRRFQAIMESIPAGAVLVRDGRVTLNGATQRMLGYSNEDIRTLDDWFLKTRAGNVSSAERARRDYEDLMASGNRRRVTRQFVAKDGTHRIVDVASFSDQLGDIWLLHDLTERLASEEKFRVLFEQSSEAFVLVVEGGIADANQAAVEMLGCLSVSDLSGKQPSDFSPQYQPDGALSAVKAAEVNHVARRRGHYRFEWVHQSLDGRVLPCEVSVTELTIGGKSAQLVAWRDLTPHKEAEAKLRRSADELRRMAEELQVANERLIEARDAALESSRAKSRFLATVSHEIRTPLNGVLGMTNLLLLTELDQEQREFVETIQASGQTLLRVIGDVLDLSKAEAGKLKIEPTEIDLVQTVNEVVNLFQGPARERGLLLRGRTPEGPLRVLADGVRLKQVAGNLIMNAIKFTPVGEVNVELKAKTIDDSLSLWLGVQDSGIGIAADRLDTIFESFTQASDSIQRLFGGTGLGLTITKRLVELMGGRVRVESSVGIGSVFTVSLVLPLVAGPAAPAQLPALKDLSGLRVLLVEDNAVNIMVARRNLDLLGCRVTVATSGEEAIEVARAQDFDVVLMDILMPGTDGLAATKAIHAFKPDLPVVAQTANAFEEDRIACKEAGMVAFVAKPLQSSELIQALAQARLR
jgi:PAS domain S-box-containing protein